MARDILEIQRELDELTPKEKAALARSLIDSLDESSEEDVEQILQTATAFYEDPLGEVARQILATRNDCKNSRKHLLPFTRLPRCRVPGPAAPQR